MVKDGESNGTSNAENMENGENGAAEKIEQTVFFNTANLFNLEVDLIARYLERLVLGDRAALPGVKTDINEEMLRKAGFIA